jgi:hypothetical protein
VTGNAAGGASGQGWASLGPGPVCGPDGHRPGPGKKANKKKIESRLLVPAVAAVAPCQVARRTGMESRFCGTGNRDLNIKLNTSLVVWARPARASESDSSLAS